MDGGLRPRCLAGSVWLVVFIGSEELAAGRVTRYELRADYRRVLPDVYAPKRVETSLSDRIAAAWLWSRRNGVVTGLAASAVHGADWVSPDIAIELNLANNRAPVGVVSRKETLFEDEVTRVRGMTVATIERTAFDIARRGPVGKAVQHLDALARATHFKVADVLAIAERHRGVRGCRRVPDVLDLVDAGAQSPKETWLRLSFIAGGFARPQTQIPVRGPDGYPLYYLDMGWDDVMVAVEYDGEQHRLDREQYRGDITRSEYVERRGWRRVRVIAGDRIPAIFQRAEAAGLRPTCEPPAILRPGWRRRASSQW